LRLLDALIRKQGLEWGKNPQIFSSFPIQYSDIQSATEKFNNMNLNNHILQEQLDKQQLLFCIIVKFSNLEVTLALFFSNFSHQQNLMHCIFRPHVGILKYLINVPVTNSAKHLLKMFNDEIFDFQNFHCVCGHQEDSWCIKNCDTSSIDC